MPVFTCEHCNNETTRNCLQCDINLCQACFADSHDESMLDKNHAYLNLSQRRHHTPKCITCPFQFRRLMEKMSLSNDKDKGSLYPMHLSSLDSSYFTAVRDEATPFLESRPFSNLEKGANEIVYIVHMVHPNEFYVHLYPFHKIVREMAREFRNVDNMPSVADVDIDKLYLMWNKADNMWQRCKVESIKPVTPRHNPKCTVYCIDFGSTHTVHMKDLRLLPLARQKSPPPLAIRCSLVDCLPQKYSWSTYAINCMLKIIANKEADMLVRAVDSGVLEVDLLTEEGGFNVGQALAFQECALVPRLVTQKAKHKRLRDDCVHGYAYSVYITAVVDPSKFFIRKTSLQPSFEQLCRDLAQENIALGKNNGKVFLPKVNTCYMVWVPEQQVNIDGGAWVRVWVDELLRGGNVRVFLPDIGLKLVKHWSQLRLIDEKYTSAPPYITHCTLYGLQPVKDYWSREAIEFLKGFQGRVLLMLPTFVDRGLTTVNLFDQNDKETNVSIYKEMIYNNFATKIELNWKPPELVPPAPKSKSDIAELRRRAPHASYRGQLRLEVKMLLYHSPSEFYVILQHQWIGRAYIEEKMRICYARTTLIPRDPSCWQVGDRCAVKSFAGGLGHLRAIVLGIDPTSGTAEVMYTDWMKYERVPVAMMRELTAELASYGDIPIKCHLAGLDPPDQSGEWSDVAKACLNGLVDIDHKIETESQILYVARQGQETNNSLPVELWARHKTFGGALESDIFEWRNLNAKLVEQGMAVPTNAPQDPNEHQDLDFMPYFMENKFIPVSTWQQICEYLK